MRTPFNWLNADSRTFLAQDYLLNGETGEKRLADIAGTAERLLKKPGFAAKFLDYVSRGWYSLASPIWSNFGRERGLPISCYGSTCSDTTASILRAHAEIGMMSKYGGGTSIYFGDVRGRGTDIKDNGKSAGTIPFASMFDLNIRVISQGSTRRGNCAAYWPIWHKDILDVLKIRTPDSEIQALSYGVCVPDDWLNEMIDGDEAKRDVWAAVLRARKNTGQPYIFFTDNANRAAPPEYKKLGLTIKHSQLCTEIFLSDDEYESFVCCLSSMNVLYYDEWKNTDAVEILTYLLEAVMTEFITKVKGTNSNNDTDNNDTDIEKARGKYGMERAVRFAERQRALGLGQLGWHSYLQSRMIPFESMEAKRLNVEIAKTIQKQSLAASQKMAVEYGEPEYLKGSGRRHMTLQAIAPTKSSSFILEQVSEGIQPFTDNYTIKDNQKMKATFRNPHLIKLIADKGLSVDDVMESVLKHGGSVQHLHQLDQHEKDVFKTFKEISPMECVVQAAQRQPYIDQGQSLNLIVDPKVPTRDVNKLLLDGWRMGIKSYYYQDNENAAQQLARSITNCTSCEG